MLNNSEYPSFEVASKKLRTFLKTDYSDFINKIEQGDLNDSN